jgi:uncharacterized membrane protein YhhN
VNPFFLPLFVILAFLDWAAVARGAKGLEYIAKPGALAALVGYAATGPAPPPWLFVALGCSLAGDVLLMLPQVPFVSGLAAFLAAHVAYVVVFGMPLGAVLPWFAVVLAAGAPVIVRVLVRVRPAPLRAAVAVYVCTIGAMAASAIASGSTLAAAGALLFVASDSLLAWNRFVAPLPAAPLAIMVTYHLGQLGLTAALR